MPAACSMICLDVDVHKDSITTAVQPRTPSVADERVAMLTLRPRVSEAYHQWCASTIGPIIPTRDIP